MIIKATRENLTEVILKSSSVIKRGGVAVLPFDTVYGFACDARNDKALEKIFAIKSRDRLKPIGIAVSNFEDLDSISILKENQKKFIFKKVPGRYTFILKSRDERMVSKNCRINGTVGVRIPDSELILGIIKKSGGIIAQTSANKSGFPETYSIGELRKQYTASELNKINLIVDGGKIENRGASRIFDLTETKPKEIERK